MSRAVFIAALVCAAPAFAETRYFSELADVPLPAGFAENDAAVGFDSDHGRLVMSEATGAAAPDRVRAFYLDCLPALGWSFSPAGEGVLVFVRGRERLTMMLSTSGGRTRLHAQLVMRPASMNAN